jgi:hypothetical protein
MERSQWCRRGVIVAILLVQPVPLLLFPPAAFSASSQQWWLPALLAVLVAIGTVQLLVRSGSPVWPWRLLEFGQGFNIISRLMMLWPHATKVEAGATVLDGLSVILSLLAMGLSAALLWYLEWPEVRLALQGE